MRNLISMVNDAQVDNDFKKILVNVAWLYQSTKKLSVKSNW